MTPNIRIPDRVQAINDRGEKVCIAINVSKEIEEALTRVGQDLDSETLPGAERRLLTHKSLSLHTVEGDQHKVTSGFLCVNPIANQWWLEGLGSDHGGAFFMSKTEQIRDIS